MKNSPTWFQRFVLPGLAFKAIVIGGGYATGRELAEFFLPSGPRGGLLGMATAVIIWSIVCATTFLLARATGALDYRTFFKELLGPMGFLFELAYMAFVIVILAVFAAAAGVIGTRLFGWPELAGTLALMAGIAIFTAFGNASVERLFKWVSIMLYTVYGVFVILALTQFGTRVVSSFATYTHTDGWLLGGLAYSGYNVIGAIVVLPVVRHFTSDTDALKAGLLAGPLAMLPALLFFVCMCAFYPQISSETFPSDYLLRRMGHPLFQFAFELMIFSALLESGTGSVNAINERISRAYRGNGTRVLPSPARFTIAVMVLVSSVFLATRYGLVTLIANGYRWLSYLLLCIYVLPLMTLGVWRLARKRRIAS